jgi:FLYWCH zinc finger domain
MLTISQHGTSKQRARLDLDGFSYVNYRTTDEKIYWRCIKYKADNCHARLHTCRESTPILKNPGEHTGKVDATESHIRLFSQQVAKRAFDTQETPEMIITQCYKGTSQ